MMRPLLYIVLCIASTTHTSQGGVDRRSVRGNGGIRVAAQPTAAPSRMSKLCAWLCCCTSNQQTAPGSPIVQPTTRNSLTRTVHISTRRNIDTVHLLSYDTTPSHISKATGRTSSLSTTRQRPVPIAPIAIGTQEISPTSSSSDDTTPTEPIPIATHDGDPHQRICHIAPTEETQPEKPFIPRLKDPRDVARLVRLEIEKMNQAEYDSE